MERGRNPEEKPRELFDDCSDCEKRYNLTKKNTKMVEYSQAPEFNFAFCECPHCNGQTLIFVCEETIRLGEQHGITIGLLEYPDEDIEARWYAAHGLEKVKEYPLTPRLEDEVAHFADTLNKMPSDLLYDALAVNGIRGTMPERWIN